MVKSDGKSTDTDRCEDCGGEIDTPRLTPDGHPKGPNLVVCTDCETRHIGGAHSDDRRLPRGDELFQQSQDSAIDRDGGSS